MNNSAKDVHYLAWAHPAGDKTQDRILHLQPTSNDPMLPYWEFPEVVAQREVKGTMEAEKQQERLASLGGPGSLIQDIDYSLGWHTYRSLTADGWKVIAPEVRLSPLVGNQIIHRQLDATMIDTQQIDPHSYREPQQNWSASYHLIPLHGYCVVAVLSPQGYEYIALSSQQPHALTLPPGTTYGLIAFESPCTLMTIWNRHRNFDSEISESVHPQYDLKLAQSILNQTFRDLRVCA